MSIKNILKICIHIILKKDLLKYKSMYKCNSVMKCSISIAVHSYHFNFSLYKYNIEHSIKILSYLRTS